MSTTSAKARPTKAPIDVRHHGRGSAQYVEKARAAVLKALGGEHEPVLRAKVRLTHLTNRSDSNRHVVQVNVSLPDRLLRVHVAAPSFEAAIGQACRRLEERIRRDGRDWENVRRRHDARPDVLASEPSGHVTRWKRVPPVRLDVAEAVAEMLARDYDFFLYVDRESGSVTVVAEEAGSTLLYRAAPTDGCVTAPSMPEDQAVQQLIGTGRRFLAYTPVDGAGVEVVYRRLDGHVGQISVGA